MVRNDPYILALLLFEMWSTDQRPASTQSVSIQILRPHPDLLNHGVITTSLKALFDIKIWEAPTSQIQRLLKGKEMLGKLLLNLLSSQL